MKPRQYEDLRAGQRYCERLPRPWPRQGATCGKGLQAESGRGSVKPLIEIISDNTVQGEQTWPIPAVNLVFFSVSPNLYAGVKEVPTK